MNSLKDEIKMQTSDFESGNEPLFLGTDDQVKNDSLFDLKTKENQFKAAPKSLHETLDNFNLENNFGITYLENSQNLNEVQPRADLIDQEQPFDSLAAAGKFLREALDVRNYWYAMENIGAEVAQYKWAYDQGELGDFDGKAFIKEALKSGVRTLGSQALNTAGNMLTMFGANLSDKPAYFWRATLGDSVTQSGEYLQQLGQTFRDYAETFSNLSILAPQPEAFDDKPNYMKLANVIGGGASQVLAMGTVAKFIGAAPAYGLFAGSSAGEVFNETLNKTHDVDQANFFAAANAGLTFSIDKIFNPLPKTVAQNARETSRLIAKEIVGAPLREAGSEVLQQMLAENLVRKVGFDETQDLFEGLIESAIGAFAGSSFLALQNGGVYLAGERYQRIKESMIKKGVSDEELLLAEKGMMSLLEEKPEAFEKIFLNNFKRNIELLKQEIKSVKDQNIKDAKEEAIKGFPKVYDTLFERANEAFGDESKAKLAAGVLSSGIISLYRMNENMTPQKMIEKYLPQFKQMSYAQFLAQTNINSAVSYMFGGQHAKKANLSLLSDAIVMDEKGYDARDIWQHTGWHIGSDDLARFEISDAHARLKNFDVDSDEIDSQEFILEQINTLEKTRAQMAAILRPTAQGEFSDYYKQFWNYLESSSLDFMLHPHEDLEDPLFAKQGYFDIIDQADENKRLEQSLYLKQLWDDYQNKTRDFSSEEYQMLMAMWENRRYQSFIEKYWDVAYGKTNALFGEFLNEQNEKFQDDPKFFARVQELLKEIQNQKKARRRTLKDLGMPDKPELYVDLDLDKAYRTYVLYSGDLSGDLPDKNYRLPAYEEAFSAKTSSERFLEQPQFDFLPQDRKRMLADFLDREEFFYRVDRHLKYVKDLEKNKKQRLYRAGVDALGKDLYPESVKKHLAGHVLVQNGENMKLGDVLDHQELFENYPQISDAQVEFKVLKDDQPYHFYHDNQKGYVFEIDASQIDYATLKEVLLKGASFAVQDIEGFDYSLSNDDRRNFMDRQVFMAKKELSQWAEDSLADFLREYPVDDQTTDFIKRQKFPVSLLQMTQSISADRQVHTKNVSFNEVDYDKLTAAVSRFFDHPQNEHEEYLRRRALYALQNMRSRYQRAVVSLARVRGGISNAGFAFGGLVSEGAMNERMMLQRMNYDDNQRSSEPFFETYPLKKPYKFDVMATEEEFWDMIKEDRKNFKAQIEAMAEGAYEYANQTINLFENGDAKTIVHESFHYFWDMLQRSEMSNNTNVIEFFSAMDDLRWEVLRRYKIISSDGKYFVIGRKDGELMKQLMRGFDSAGEASDAAVQELFVDKFLQVMDKKLNPNADIASAMDFYRRFLFELTGHLNITKEKSGLSGRKVLKFIKDKIYRGD